MEVILVASVSWLTLPSITIRFFVHKHLHGTLKIHTFTEMKSEASLMDF